MGQIMLVFRKYRNALIITLAAKPRSNAGGSSLCDQPLPHFLPHAPPFPPSRSSFSLSYPPPTSVTFSHFLFYSSFTPFLILPTVTSHPPLPLSHFLTHFLIHSLIPFLTTSCIPLSFPSSLPHSLPEFLPHSISLTPVDSFLSPYI